MERILNRNFNWVKYNHGDFFTTIYNTNTSIIGYDDDKNIFYRFNIFNQLLVFNDIKNIYDASPLLINYLELKFLRELRTKNLPSLEIYLSLEKYFNRIKVINSIL